jgi:hypothetical protein
MIPLNVSFGIYAFLPMGWLFMAFVILGEGFLMSWYLTGKKFEKKTYQTAALSNIVSGAVGIITTLELNGGWWLVVWFPWVSKHEVDIHDPQSLWTLVLFYFAALILSVLIELLINHLMLQKRFPFKKTLHATLIANAFSYVLGAVLIVLLCI